ncbi:MAG: peptidylprolyl isomerase [Firmicutes bacterium]|nr:peptidylprolyl isomerase [Bacillota bacterium]
MGEILKENWFVVLIAVIIIGFVGYFVYDNNKYNVSGKTSDGSSVLATVASEDITSDAIYEKLSANDDALLFSLYRNAVINEYVQTTDDLKSQAKNMQLNIEANASSNSQGDYKLSIATELGNFGYGSFDELRDYCLTFAKEKQMDVEYIEKNFEDLRGAVEEKQARTVSIISMAVVNPEELTEEETKKKDLIDTEIEKESFGKAATELSEDAATASSEGYLGYVDADTQATTLPAEVLEAAKALNKGETSDWVTVTDQNYGTTKLYKVRVEETDLKKIYDDGNETIKNNVISAILSDNAHLDITIVEEAAKKVDIKFTDKAIQKRIESYISDMKGEN